MDIVVLPANQPADRFYRGGPRIQAFRGEEPRGDRIPEDWIGSTTTIRGEASLGLTTLPDGRILRDAIADDPEGWLGREHLDAFGVDTMLLVKLLDAGQRLPVHAHPDGPFAKAHLGTGHGKAEAWFILEPGDVHLGLLRDVEADELAALVDAQDARALLALLHRVPVRSGDTVMVPPGVLHAIGAGVLLAEVQEPEDLSILLEWRDFELDGARDGHLGLGFDTALRAVETRGRTTDEIAALVSGGTEGDVLAGAAAPYFRFELLTAGGSDADTGAGAATATTDAGFAVLIVLDGELTLHAQGDPDARPVRVERGTTAVLPHAAGALTVTGAGRILLARPPRR